MLGVLGGAVLLPRASPAQAPNASASSCAVGQAVTIDTAGHCCWRDQAWSTTRGQCVGVPACPAGSEATAERCVPRARVDPLHGSFSLAEATGGIPGTGPLIASIDTSLGMLSCRLFDDKAPVTVANFIGLATGKRTWLDSVTGSWTNRPAYDGTTFHRIIQGFMIQGGDAKGNGTGEPGYTFSDEMWPGGTHDRAGLLCTANRGRNTNGAQFFITESDGPAVKALDGYGTYTIFGDCSPLAVIHAIAAVPTGPRDRPITPVTINSVRIRRSSPRSVQQE